MRSKAICTTLLLLTCLTAVSLSAGEAPPASGDSAALLALDNARRAYNEGKFDAAVAGFRDFLKKYTTHRDAPAASYGLGLALLDLPQKDYKSAIEAFQAAGAKNDFADRGMALYYLASTQRAVGQQTLDSAAAKPTEAVNIRKTAQDQFVESAKSFGSAADAFSDRMKNRPAGDAGIDSDRDWMLRSRADQAELLIRADKSKEAADASAAVLKDKALAKSPILPAVLYENGCAQFALKDYFAAGRSLSQLAPFDQDFGIHARYLLSRIHHLAGERPEASAGYKALLENFNQKRAAAAEALKNPQLKPDERAKFDKFVKVTPDYIPRAMFYASLLAMEGGEFGEAMSGLNLFVQQFPKDPLGDEVKLRLGYCYVQMKNLAEATKYLQPLQNHAQLSDRAEWWLAKAAVASVDPANAQAFDPVAKKSIEMLIKAADKAGEFGKTDADAKVRRGDILLDLADTQQAARQYKDAAATYAKIVTENSAPDHVEAAMQRQATMLNMAGQFKESEELCQKFEKTYPKSILLAAIWFCAAENANLDAAALQQAEKEKPPAAGAAGTGWQARYDEAVKRYHRLVEKYPEFPHVNLARFGMASAQFQRGKYEEAIASLVPIAEADRNNELAAVNSVMADCMIRLIPNEANDALQAGKVIDLTEQASRLLEKYIGSTQAKTQQTADALVKLAYCYQRKGAIMIDPAERQKILAQSRQLYERFFQEYGNNPMISRAVMERARVIALQGDINGAINEYNRFTGDPLKQSVLTPLALIREASLLRTVGRAPDAEKLLANCRKEWEPKLQQKEARVEWIPLLQYEHALALKDTNKIAEARAIFDGIVKQYEKYPEAANALWRSAECRREELQAAFTAARAVQIKPGVKPEEITAATKTTEDGLKELREISESLKSSAAKYKASKESVGDAPMRMLYEAAWCSRVVGEGEVEAERRKITSKAMEKVVEGLKKAVPNQPVPPLSIPDVALSAIGEQPGEKAAQELYRALLAMEPPSALASRARVEWAEMESTRGRNDAALELFATALEDNPPQEQVERIRVRIGTCLLAKEDAKGAQAQAQLVLKNQNSPLAAEALMLMGECAIQNKDWGGAINHFVAFRDRDPFRGIPNLADRGLQRLGFAFAEAKRWDESRQALEILIQRFPQSALVPEARYGMGWAFQSLNQHDNAYNNYIDVTRRSAGEIAAKAQMQMGMCRLIQKRWPDAAKDLLAAASIYDYPEITAASLCEAGQAYIEQKNPAEAKKVLETVVKDHANSKWAETAKQRLGTIK